MNRFSIITLFFLFSLGFPSLVGADGDFSEYFIDLDQGWNLVWAFLPDENIGKNDNSVIAVYSYIPTIGEYARLYPDPELDKLRKIDDDYFKNTAMWVYSENGTREFGEYYAPNPLPLDEFKLYNGWNMVGVVPEMLGKSLGDLQGSCNIMEIAGWEDGEWILVNPDNYDDSDHPDIPGDFLDLVIADSEGDIGNGLLVKVTGGCSLNGEGNYIPPPPVPSNNQVICTDSDDGKDYTERGHLLDEASGGADYWDICIDAENAEDAYANGGNVVESGNVLKEYYCGVNNYQYEYYDCENGCNQGACI